VGLGSLLRLAVPTLLRAVSPSCGAVGLSNISLFDLRGKTPNAMAFTLCMIARSYKYIT
jgi:hypothetical protein